MSTIPQDLLYTKEHEWVKTEGNKATVGITHFAQNSLGDVVYADLPKAGTTVTQDGNAGTIESVKAVSDIFSPLGGTISEQNPLVNKDPAVVNRDPYNEGWLFKLADISEAEFKNLLSADQYAEFLKTL